MNNNPKISIAIPTYNGGDYIKLQLKRFVNETNNIKFKNFFEIIISDNASTDNTKTIINNFLNNNYKNTTIKYYRQKKNLGYYENFISAIKKTRGEYLLTLVDHDVPQKGFYLQLLAKFKNKNYKNLIFLPFEKVKPYKKKIFGLNKLGYVVERGSSMSGIILKKKELSLKYIEKSLYVQNIIFVDYFLKFGMKQLRLKSRIKKIGTAESVTDKFNDRVNRGDDYATSDKLKSIEIFYNNKKINFLEYFITIYKIYTWCLEIKWNLKELKRHDLEKKYFYTLLKNKRKIISVIFLFIFLKNIFNKKKFFYLDAFLKSI
jgi:glycosyltransferase involved in cell wall biosynthesis